MAARDLKVLLKTMSDASGLTKLGGYLKAHSLAVKGLAATYKVAGAAGKAAFSLIGAELRFRRNAAAGGAGALALAAREGAKLNISLAQTVNMFAGNKLANFVKFRTEILNLSSEVGIATDKINAALYTAGSAQMAPEQAFAAIRKSVQGVVADGAELNDVLSGIIAGVKSFGGDVDQTAEQLYRIVQLGQTTFGEVGQYLSQVAPVAAANKVSLGEVGGAIAQLTSKTIPLSQTVNMLRNMMSKLNMELGDGWSQTRTFQEAIEEVARSANYSQVALAKAFGLENLAGVNALIGENFAQSTQQLAEFTGELTGLAEASQFADQFRGWAKVWESMRNYVKEIGSEIEQRWAPRIQFIASKINELRQGEGWTALVDRVAAKLESTVTWVIVQVKTASDLIQQLRDSDFGTAKLAVLGKTVVTELITMAVTLLVELLKANATVFIAIGKLLAAGLKEELIGLLRKIPGFSKSFGNVAMDAFEKADYDAQLAMANSKGFDTITDMLQSDAFVRGDLDAAMSGIHAVPELLAAIDQAKGNMGAAAGRVGAQWDQSAGNIKAAAGVATGGEFNWDARAAANRAEVTKFMATPATPAAPENPENTEKARIRAEIARLQAEQRGLDMDEPDDLRKAVEKEQAEASAARAAAAGFSMPGMSTRSFSYKEGLRAAENRAAAEEKEAAAAIAALENSMNLTRQRYEQLLSQIENYNEMLKRLPV